MNSIEAFLKDYEIIKGIYSAYNAGGIEGLAKSYKTHIDTLDYQELQLFSKELSEYAMCYYTYNSVYDAMDEMGGMLRYGIPEYRLPKAVLRNEVEAIAQLGVTMKNNVRIGTDISFDAIRNVRKDR